MFLSWEALECLEKLQNLGHTKVYELAYESALEKEETALYGEPFVKPYVENYKKGFLKGVLHVGREIIARMRQMGKTDEEIEYLLGISINVIEE